MRARNVDFFLKVLIISFPFHWIALFHWKKIWEKIDVLLWHFPSEIIQFFNQDFQFEFPFLFPLFGRRKGSAYISKLLQLERAVSSKLEYIALISEKINEKLIQFSTLFKHKFVFDLFWVYFYFSLELPTTLSRRLYIINALQNALGTELQRFCVNFLLMVNKNELKHLQWQCPKLFWLCSHCKLITCLGLKKTSSFAAPHKQLHKPLAALQPSIFPCVSFLQKRHMSPWTSWGFFFLRWEM